MADANEVIKRLGLQLAQALIDKTVAEVEALELRATLAAAGVVEVAGAEEGPAAPREG